MCIRDSRDAGRMDDGTGQRGQTSTAFVATGETNGTYARYALQITFDTLPAATHEMLCIGLSLPTGGHRITGVQLEPGPVATLFEHRPYGTELALCQRYYQLFAEVGWVGRGTSAPDSGLTLAYNTKMRANPSASISSQDKGTNFNAYTKDNSAILFSTSSDYNQVNVKRCLLYTSPSPRDRTRSRMPSSA